MDELPFRRLGEFELIRELGRGGMGVVYEAVQSSLGRRVALKVLADRLGLTPKAAERFRREAATAAKLHHTNIVPVYKRGLRRHAFLRHGSVEGPSRLVKRAACQPALIRCRMCSRPRLR